MTELEADIRAYYQTAPEVERLEAGPGRLEFVRTQEIILRYLPEAPARILDVGAGPGRYAMWLSSLGHEVHLIDPVESLVAQAMELSMAASDPPASFSVGDARRLDWADNQLDAAVCLGPLYHLTARKDRLAALREVHRALRPGGLLFAAVICRYASALDGLARGLLGDPRFVRIVQKDLADGQHRNPTERTDYFTRAYFHRPEEVGPELEEVGFQQETLLGVEGPAWLLADFDKRWEDPLQRAAILETIRLLETEPSLLGASAHLLAVARKPLA